MDELQRQHQELGWIIDLTNTTRYYNLHVTRNSKIHWREFSGAIDVNSQLLSLSFRTYHSRWCLWRYSQLVIKFPVMKPSWALSVPYGDSYETMMITVRGNWCQTNILKLSWVTGEETTAPFYTNFWFFLSLITQTNWLESTAPTAWTAPATWSAGLPAHGWTHPELSVCVICV